MDLLADFFPGLKVEKESEKKKKRKTQETNIKGKINHKYERYRAGRKDIEERNIKSTTITIQTGQH